MLTSDLIQMLLDAQKRAGEEVEIRGALLDDECGARNFNQSTIVGVELFHNPNTDEQHVKLIMHERPNRNGDKLLSEIKTMIRDGFTWNDRHYLEKTNVENN